MEISSFSFPPQQDFTSPPPPPNNNHQSMSKKRKFEDFDDSSYPVQEILNNFVRSDKEINSYTNFDHSTLYGFTNREVVGDLVMKEQVLPVSSSALKRAREKNVAEGDNAAEGISKSSDQEIPVQEILNNFLRPGNEVNSYTNFDQGTLYGFTNREVVGDLVMKEQLLPVSSSTLKRGRDKNVAEDDNSEEGISKSSDQEILNNFLGPDNETNSYINFDHSTHDGFTNREIVGDMVMKEEVLPVSSSALKRAREENVAADDNAEERISISTSSSQQPLQQQRRLWVKNRSNAWWEQCNRPDFPEVEFKKAFRMGKTTFDFICTELESVVTKKDTMLRLAIPVRQRVAVCIWRLATGAPLREVSKKFGLGISTCHKLVLEVCTAIRGVLMAKFVQWPDDIKMEQNKRGFEVLSGIQNVGGSMYTTHVPIIAPKESVATYFNKRHTERNQKPSYSVTIQGVVDCNGIFTDVCIGWPGSMADDDVLEKSALYERANRGSLNGIDVVGSSGFPLTDWILVPFTHKNLTWTQHAFNEKVNDVQKVAKEAFMRLKARWSCLQKRTEVKLQDLPVVLGACCVLHNICEMRGEEFSQELRFDLFDDEVVPGNVVRSMNAVQARDQIAHKLLHHNYSGTSFL